MLSSPFRFSLIVNFCIELDCIMVTEQNVSIIIHHNVKVKIQKLVDNSGEKWVGGLTGTIMGMQRASVNTQWSKE